MRFEAIEIKMTFIAERLACEMEAIQREIFRKGIMSPLMKRMLAGKEARRKELAALSFEEKLARVEKMRDRSLLLASNPLRRKAAQKSPRASAKRDK